jgi:hypothetical protein
MQRFSKQALIDMLYAATQSIETKHRINTDYGSAQVENNVRLAIAYGRADTMRQIADTLSDGGTVDMAGNRVCFADNY